MKLVRESLLEISQGKHSGLGSIGIGVTTLIKKWLEEKGITAYLIKDNGMIDVDGNIDFRKLAFESSGKYSPNIEAFPDFIQFGTVYGSFDISDCGFLNLKGCPIKVTKSFNCSENELSSLDFCPKFVYGEFACYSNLEKFTKEYVKSKCTVKRGIFVSASDYYENSWDYTQMLKNEINS